MVVHKAINIKMQIFQNIDTEYINVGMRTEW